MEITTDRQDASHSLSVTSELLVEFLSLLGFCYKFATKTFVKRISHRRNKYATRLPCQTDTFDFQPVILMVLVGASKFGKTNLIFDDPGVKINGT